MTTVAELKQAAIAAIETRKDEINDGKIVKSAAQNGEHHAS